MDIPTWDELIKFVQEQMKTNQWFQTVGFFGVLSFLAMYVKGFASYLYERIKRKLLFSVTIYQNNTLFDDLETWLQENHEQVYRNVEGKSFYLESGEGPEPPIGNQSRTFKFYQYQDLFFLFKSSRILRFYKGREKLENANNITNAYYNHFRISGVLSKKTIAKFLDEVVQYNLDREAKSLNTHIQVHTNMGTSWCLESSLTPKPEDKIFIKEKYKILSDIEKFMGNKSWYLDRGIPYKRGLLLYGPPGNGKSSLSMAIASKYKKNVFVLNPIGVNDAELRALYRNLQPNCILLVEDVDAIFSKTRDKKEVGVKFNFSTLLNCMDGAFYKEGLITIFTTNHKDQLDSALIRKGRIDLDIEITDPEPLQIERYVQNFYADDTIILDKSKLKKLSMAEVQDICLKNHEDYYKTVKTLKIA